MRIAQIAPLIESVPPRLYGGTERVVSYLTEELVQQGHEVTLFASADSQTCARLVACAPSALRLEPRSLDPWPHYMLMLEQVRRHARSFELMHFHIDYLHFPLIRELQLPTLTTLHGRQDIWDLQPLFREYADVPLASISMNQRMPLPMANWVATVHHGLPENLLPFSPGGGEYLVFLGRLCQEKRVDRAIDIATRAGRELLIAAKVDNVDRAHFESCIKPLMNRPNVRFLGEVNEKEKGELLGGALALLFPIDWPEPFGLTMIESLACGTPVIAWDCGSVPEIIEDGVTGWVVNSVYEAVSAVDRVSSLHRKTVRGHFERRFSAERMASDYIDVYERLVTTRPASVHSAA
ncbi:MAG: glycosyltransferase family 4 protein [Woeseia sp.]